MGTTSLTVYILIIFPQGQKVLFRHKETGLLSPSEGSIRIDGEIGYMLQKDYLLEYLLDGLYSHYISARTKGAFPAQRNSSQK